MATINQITVNSTTYDLAVSAANVSGTVANATTATKLGTANKGSATQPIYLSAGSPAACTYSLAKSVPANAKFTDTTYSTFVKSGSSAAAGLVPKPSTTAGTTKYLREDGEWVKPPDTNTTYSAMTAATSSAAGKAGLVPAPAAGAQAKFLRGDGTWQTSYTLPTASSSTLGGVKVGTGLGISSGTLSVSYGTTATTACKGDDSRLSDSRTPKEHRSTAKTYGQGDETYFGHVKVSDSYATSGGTAASGVAASSYALNQLYTVMKVYMDNLSSKNIVHHQESGLNFERYNNILYVYGYIKASLSPGWTKVSTVPISHKLMFDENIYFVIVDDSSPQDDYMFLEARIDAKDAGIYVYSFTSITNHILRFNTSCPIYSEY